MQCLVVVVYSRMVRAYSSYSRDALVVALLLVSLVMRWYSLMDTYSLVEDVLVRTCVV